VTSDEFLQDRNNWGRSDCEELNHLTSGMLSAGQGGSSGDFHAAFQVGVIGWLISLENRVRAIEGKEPIKYDTSAGDGT
jgi:hypothetical protein